MHETTQKIQEISDILRELILRWRAQERVMELERHLNISRPRRFVLPLSWRPKATRT